MGRKEEAPGTIRREPEVVQTENGAVEAWVCWGLEDLPEGKRRLAGGDWFERG